LGRFIIESPRITKVWVGEGSFKGAWKKFTVLKNKPLSFTDCTSIAIIESNGIKQIMSFDSGFDGLITRIC
jgi:predicted nucleic acid-binding protein